MVMTLVVDIEYLAAPTKEDIGRARRRLVWWLDVRSQIRQSICSLDPAKGEMGLEIAIWSKSDHAIETYRAAVVAQERLFTQLDYQAMKTWVEQAPKRRASVVHQHKIQQAWCDVYGGREELIALHGSLRLNLSASAFLKWIASGFIVLG